MPVNNPIRLLSWRNKNALTSLETLGKQRCTINMWICLRLMLTTTLEKHCWLNQRCPIARAHKLLITFHACANTRAVAQTHSQATLSSKRHSTQTKVASLFRRLSVNSTKSVEIFFAVHISYSSESLTHKFLFNIFARFFLLLTAYEFSIRH